MIQLTTQELCAKLDISWLLAHSLLQILHSRGLARRVGYRRANSGVGGGRPHHIWELNNDAIFNFQSGTVITSESGPEDT
jgi:predicted ArsR family transcriptional regulator